jgi:hypothetical protein
MVQEELQQPGHVHVRSVDLIHHQEATVQAHGAQVCVSRLDNGKQRLIDGPHRHGRSQEALGSLASPLALAAAQLVVVLPTVILFGGEQSLGRQAVDQGIARYS